ncbi:MAG: ZIP family metal transporter [Congregibacter sp.]
MSPIVLLLAYGAALVAISIFGGNLPERVAMTHTRTQMAMSLVSGLMLGIAFFHLLPHSLLTLGVDHGLNIAMAWVMLGLITMLMLLRILHFHQPDYPADVLQTCEHGHSHSQGVAHEDETPDPVIPAIAPGSWRGVLLGLTFHTFIDGVALGAALLSAPHGNAEQLMGFGVFLAILLHKPLDAMSITALMKAGGASTGARQRANLLFAFVCPLGAAVFYLYAPSLGDSSPAVIAAALAFSAGAFMCIALSDLLPEVQFHSHDRVKLTALFLFGIGLSYLMASSSPQHSHAVVSELPVPIGLHSTG